MASVLTHAVFAFTAAKVYASGPMPWRFWIVSVLCSILPDADVVGFAFGVPYEAFWGHRGFTHSLAFAALLSIAVVAALSPPLVHGAPRKAILFAYFFIVTASHGVLDAMTDGGLGVAFFSPFDTTRYFLPWRPIVVSPIGPAYFFSRWGWEVIVSEVSWVWPWCGLVVVACALWRRQVNRGAPSRPDSRK